MITLHGVLPVGGCQGSAELILLIIKQKIKDNQDNTFESRFRHLLQIRFKFARVPGASGLNVIYFVLSQPYGPAIRNSGSLLLSDNLFPVLWLWRDVYSF